MLSMKFHLEPGDVLVNVITGNSLYNKIKRACLGSPYSHVFMYMGGLFIEKPGEVFSRGFSIPMLFESSGRGVVLQSLSNRYGEEVVVMRLKSEHDHLRIPYILDEAIKLASETQAYYDYLCILRFVLPRLIFEKLRLPMPLKWHRDPWHICSEAVFEVFYRAKIPVLTENIAPLPGDFVTDSVLLDKVWAGELSEGVVGYD